MMKEKNLSQQIAERLERFRAKKRILEGEIELPHQADPFKPDEIIEIEQSAPEEIISREDIYLAERHEQVSQAVFILKKEENRQITILNKHRIIKEKIEEAEKLVIF